MFILGILNIVIIGIANKFHEHELHCLLSTMFSMEQIVEEKLGIIKNEYSIQVGNEFIKYVSAMYDFLQEIREKGRAYGRIRAKNNYPEYA